MDTVSHTLRQKLACSMQCPLHIGAASAIQGSGANGFAASVPLLMFEYSQTTRELALLYQKCELHSRLLWTALLQVQCYHVTPANILLFLKYCCRCRVLLCLFAQYR